MVYRPSLSSPLQIFAQPHVSDIEDKNLEAAAGKANKNAEKH